MANGCHLVTLRLDTALIDDVGRDGVVGEVVFAFVSPNRPYRDVLDVLFRGGSALAKLVCPAREVFLLVVSCFSRLTLILLICMLVLQRSWSPVLWHVLVP